MSSLGSRRTAYPASRSMSAAVSLSVPLLGTAIFSNGLLSGKGREGGTVCRSQMSVDVLGTETAREEHHLQVVQELRDLLGQALVGLVLRRHPDLRGLLHDLLADRVHAGVELRDGAGSGGPGLRLGRELGEQVVEGLHRPRLPVRRAPPGRAARRLRGSGVFTPCRMDGRSRTRIRTTRRVVERIS